MPQGPDGNTIIIVKKVSGHAGAHGGAWKVAYADFVTSMMALFMVLWLVNTASVVTRERIASYFKRPGIFEKGSGTPLQMGESGILKEAFGPPTTSSSDILPDEAISSPDVKGGLRTEGITGGQFDGVNSLTHEQLQEAKRIQTEQFAKAAAEIKEILEDAASGMGQFSVKVDDAGLHIEIMDTPTASMFALGSSEILGGAHSKVNEIAEILKKLPNPIDIEGHTDSRPYRTKKGYDNWDLSSDRANAARRVLEQAGINPKQISSVIGYADRKPKNVPEPMHDSNRRITISMRYSEDAAAHFKDRLSVGAPTTPSGVAATRLPTKAPTGTVAGDSIAGSSTSSVRTVPSAILGGEDFKDFSSSSSVSSSATSVAKPLNGNVASTVSELSASSSSDYGRKHVSSVASSPTSAPSNSSLPTWREKDKIFGGKNPFAE